MQKQIFGTFVEMSKKFCRYFVAKFVKFFDTEMMTQNNRKMKFLFRETSKFVDFIFQKVVVGDQNIVSLKKAISTCKIMIEINAPNCTRYIYQ